MQNSQEDANIKYQSEKNEALLDRDQLQLLTLCTLAQNLVIFSRNLMLEELKF